MGEAGIRFVVVGMVACKESVIKKEDLVEFISDIHKKHKEEIEKIEHFKELLDKLSEGEEEVFVYTYELTSAV